MRRISPPLARSAATVLLLFGVCGIMTPAAGAWRAAAPAAPSVPRYHTTTGPTPPPTVVKGYARTAARATAADHLIAGVPVYTWRHGCGPTATGMVIGYYDTHGFDELIAGDASTQTTDVLQAIASDQRDGGGVGHYQDYSWPRDDGGARIPDMSELPAGDEHAGDSVADFMHTSWSAEGLTYGGSWTNMVGPAFIGYVDFRQPVYSPSSADYYVGNPVSMTTWTVLKGEVDADRPMVLIVDCTGDGALDHAVTGVGYRETDGLLEYAYLNTWDTGIHWSRYHPPTAGDAWGIWGITALRLSGGAPPSPPPDPTPSADTTPPVTVVIGAYDAWHGGPVSLTFAATDIGSGVARTEASLDGGLAWREGTSLLVEKQGVHTVLFRSLDKAGNIEPDRSCTVRIDTVGPTTSARAGSVARGRRASLRYRVDDLGRRASVRLVVKNARRKTVKTVALGLRATNTDLKHRFVCKLEPGAYRFYVYATDPAGNTQQKPASAKLTVR